MSTEKILPLGVCARWTSSIVSRDVTDHKRAVFSELFNELDFRSRKKEEDLSYALGWGFPGVPPVQYGQDGYSDPSSVDTCQVGKDEI